MRLVLLLGTSFVVGGFCATEVKASPDARALAFGCGDTVVIGTVANGSYQHDDSADDLLGHGWTSATVRVRRLVRGPLVPPEVPVRYYSHAQMRHDREFMLVLKRTDFGFEVASAQLMSVRPRFAPSCR